MCFICKNKVVKSTLIHLIRPLTSVITEQQFKGVLTQPIAPHYLGPGGWAVCHLNPVQHDQELYQLLAYKLEAGPGFSLVCFDWQEKKLSMFK